MQSKSHYLMAIRWGKSGNSDRFYFGEGFRITADCDHNHEIKRRFGRKAMTNLDSILKSTDTTLPTKVQIVKAMVFKGLNVTELKLSNCGVGEDS